VQTSDGHANDYTMMVLAGTSNYLTAGTWIQVSNSDELGAQQWTTSYSCDPSDSIFSCTYIGPPQGYVSEQFPQVETWVELDQLNPDGSICHTTRALGHAFGQTASSNFTITNAVHHFPISYILSAPVSPNCGGSRQFKLDLHFAWKGGNPIKLDGGTGHWPRSSSGRSVCLWVCAKLSSSVPAADAAGPRIDTAMPWLQPRCRRQAAHPARTRPGGRFP